MSLETRSLVLPGEIGYHSTYGSIQAGHNKDDNSDMDDDDTRRPLYKRSSVVSVSSFSEVHVCLLIIIQLDELYFFIFKFNT